MNSQRFHTAIALIDKANAEDPNLEISEREKPKELLYGQRMSECLDRFCPDASEFVRVAARAQHLRRWLIPREDYPSTREGYLRWRSFLYDFHAEQVEPMLREAGYEDEAIAHVKKMVSKRGLKNDPDVQVIEDVACLVFLKHYLVSFASDHDEEKLIGIIRKTWRKMSALAQAEALKMELPPPLSAMIRKALETGAEGTNGPGRFSGS